MCSSTEDGAPRWVHPAFLVLSITSALPSHSPHCHRVLGGSQDQRSMSQGQNKRRERLQNNTHKTHTFDFQQRWSCRNPPLLALGYPEVRPWWSWWVLPAQGVLSFCDSLSGSMLIAECQRKGCVCAVLDVCQLRASNCLESKCSEQLGWIALCKHAD